MTPAAPPVEYQTIDYTAGRIPMAARLAAAGATWLFGLALFLFTVWAISWAWHKAAK